MSSRFRPDIEGLRALAILPILAFHLDPKLCPGGFIGVDIFFVISGYLISGMILEQGADFSFRSFYVRRVLRLAPALLVTLLGTLVVGWRYFGPVEFAELGRTAIAAVFGVSNLYFFSTFDYFAPAGTSQPLLHTWSLGLEEQVYLIWPLLLTFAARRKALAGTIATIGVASFALAFVLQSAQPQAVFYLMPFRLFEFAIGGAVVLAAPLIAKLSSLARAIAGTFAALMLGACFVLIDSGLPWPSTATLVPSLATALLLAVGATGVWGRVLAFAPLRFIGRISYSVYLVHWPVIVFYRAHAITDASKLEFLLLAGVTIALGTALYVFVETPFRSTGAAGSAKPIWVRHFAFPVKYRLAGAVALIIAATASATATIVTKGFPHRLDRARVQLLDKGLTYAGDVCDQRFARCTFGSKNADRVVYVIGDSHALNLVHGLDALFQEWGIRGVAFYDHGCLFAYGTKRFINGVSDDQCMANVQRAYDFLATSRDPVIIAGNYLGYVNQIGFSDAKAPLRQDLNDYMSWVEERMVAGLKLLRPETRPVVVVRQTYTSGISLPACLAQPDVNASNADAKCTAFTRTQNRERNARVDHMFDALSSAFPSIESLDPVAAFCPEEHCKTTSIDGSLFLRDSDHLTNEGSLFFIAHVRESLKRSFERVRD